MICFDKKMLFLELNDLTIKSIEKAQHVLRNRINFNVLNIRIIINEYEKRFV
jgi:hypothetical protein